MPEAEIIITKQDITPEVMMSLLSGEMTLDDIKKKKRSKRFRRKIGNLQNQIEAEYEKLSTRNLLSIKNSLFYAYDPDGMNEIRHYAIKKVLAKREHVPNSIEAKEIRRKIAKINHRNRKSKNR